MSNFNEADHPRDDIGRFTYKNGGASSSTTGILEGGVEKVEYPDDWDGNDGEGGWGDVLGGIGDILGGVFGIITNPAVIQGVLGILASKYTISELKTFKEMLSVISEAKSNDANVSGYAQTNADLISHDDKNERKTQSREDILYPTMNDKKQIDNKNDILLDGISKEVYPQSNKSSYSDFLSNLVTQPQVPQYNYTGNSLKNQIAVDHINNPVLKEAATRAFGLETAENLLMSKKDSYLNTDYAKEHLIFKNYKELSTDLRNYFEKKITNQIGADKLETTGGIYINAEHYSSKELAKVLVDNKEFVKKVAEARNSMKAGNSVNTSIQFTDKNFHNAIGKADILDMHINKNGEIDLLVTDVYDFNNDKNASDLIKTGRNRQEKGEIKPYFYIYHVIIPKSAKLGESGRR